MKAFYLAVIGAGVIGYGAVDAVNLLTPTSALSGACNIKGNISIQSREHIYHDGERGRFAALRGCRLKQ